MNSLETSQYALFASGCFWGTQYHFAKAPGVLNTKVGFAGGTIENPTYDDVKHGHTGHLECVWVEFAPQQISYEALVRLFFETHNFSQENGQGPDIGPQYLSAIFFADDAQKGIAETIMQELRQKKYPVATSLRSWATFFPAEDYHQNYYERRNGTPYCHIKRKIF